MSEITFEIEIETKEDRYFHLTVTADVRDICDSFNTCWDADYCAESICFDDGEERIIECDIEKVEFSKEEKKDFNDLVVEAWLKAHAKHMNDQEDPRI